MWRPEADVQSLLIPPRPFIQSLGLSTKARAACKLTSLACSGKSPFCLSNHRRSLCPPDIYRETGDLNFGPRECSASTLCTEPSPHPLFAIVLHLNIWTGLTLGQPRVTDWSLCGDTVLQTLESRTSVRISLDGALSALVSVSHSIAREPADPASWVADGSRYRNRPAEAQGRAGSLTDVSLCSYTDVSWYERGSGALQQRLPDY